MGKRKRGNKGKGKTVKVQNNSVLGSDDEALYDDKPDEGRSDYYYDEIDEFHQEKEKLLLKEEECFTPEHFENQEEVLGVQDDSDSEDKDSEDDLPDVKAWGKKKSKYYNTDYVDNDYLGYKEGEDEIAQAEENEVLALQKRLDDEIEESDFGIEWFEKKDQIENQESLEKIGIDLEALSKEEKLEFLQKNSPELFIFVEDFKSRLAELTEKLEPAWMLIEEHKLPEGCWTDYVVTKYQTILQYCTNISFYMMIKAKGEPTCNHPVMSRLHTYKKMLEKLDAVEKHYLPIVEQLTKGVDINLIIEKEESSSNKDEKMEEIKTIKEINTEIPSDAEDDFCLKSSGSDADESDYPNNSLTSNNNNNTEEKRSITYEIAKNKGLTPHRKKEVRNPRVRHRKKYERAKVKRKGQFREPMKELQRYGGEISGIRAGVCKSIKLK
ncbi:something about silencing protein 10 isoform X2 [Centruroides vittatus]|uniref:something about silencing protein 10 isoform X2 n=1 Tax=Centruroides vittatus TaxID=120091 RepID=UPI00350FF0CD